MLPFAFLLVRMKAPGFGSMESWIWSRNTWWLFGVTGNTHLKSCCKVSLCLITSSSDDNHVDKEILVQVTLLLSWQTCCHIVPVWVSGTSWGSWAGRQQMCCCRKSSPGPFCSASARAAKKEPSRSAGLNTPTAVGFCLWPIGNNHTFTQFLLAVCLVSD